MTKISGTVQGFRAVELESQGLKSLGLVVEKNIGAVPGQKCSEIAKGPNKFI